MTQIDMLILGLLIGGFFIYHFLKTKKSIIIKRQLKKARKGENAAVKFLEDGGYTIVGIQEKKTIVTWVDGTPHHNNLKVDFIVKKGRKVYIAEVKTGQMAPRPALADTRRQLLEYYLAYRPHGILLVDMERKRIREIAFEIYGKNGKWRYVQILLLATGLGFFCGYYLYKFIDGGRF